MTEVTLVKRFSILALVALIALGTAACTRDKPSEPAVTTVVSQNVATTPGTPFSSTPVATSASAAITATVSVSSTTPAAVTPVATVAATAVPISPQPTSVPTTSSNPSTYTVQWGDWLNKIASQLGVTTQALLAANPGINPNLISPGQVLNVPGATTPSATSTPTTPFTPPTNPSTYTVQRGDWIYAIARKFGVSVAALLAANPGINPNFVFPGQVLNIPGGATPDTTPSGNTYTVQPGDTLFSIAVRFKTTTYALQIKNNLANPNFIYPGQVLILPQ